MTTLRTREISRWRLLERTWLRHLVTLAIAAAMIFLFAEARSEWSPMHKWNRAFGDASLMLIAITLGFGPLARLWRPLGKLLLYRREFGIWAVVAGGVHTIVILDGWLEWDLVRLFGFLMHPQLQQYVMVEKGFGLGNLIGIAALLYGLLLASTSNNFSQRLLGTPVWKHVQSAAYVLWMLIVAHTAYFLFIHFVDFHRKTPEPNVLQTPFVVLVLTIIALQTAASVKTWRLRRAQGGDGRVADSASRA